MKLATQLNDFKGYAPDLCGQLALFSRTRFKYLDITLPAEYPDESWEATVNALGEEAARHSLTFVQAHAVDYNPCDPARDFDTELKNMNRMIEATSMLGVKNVVLHPVYPNGFDAKYPDGKQEFFDYNKRLYSLLFPAMEKFGVNVLTENSCEINTLGRYFFMTGEDMREFIEYVGHPQLLAVWDTGHANIRKNDQSADIAALGNSLAALHIHDNDGSRDEHTGLFCGTLNIDAVMDGIIKNGYGGYFTFEANNALLRGDGWPYRRIKRKDIENKLFNPSLELRLMAEDLLYETGKYVLSQYGLFEE